MSDKIVVSIADAQEDAQAFISAWRRAEADQPPENPVHKLYFEDMETL